MSEWDTPRVSPWRDVWGRVLGESEDPISWGFTIGRLAGVRIRLSLWFVVFIASQLVWSISFDNVGPMYAITSVLALLVVVCVHELGHVIACRAAGGRVDGVLLWPLGGLEWCHPAPGWKPMLLASLGGLIAQVVLFGVTSLALLGMGRDDLIIFDLFRDLRVGAGSFADWWGVGLWWLHSLNVIVLVLNLIPTLPLDGARVLESWLSRRRLSVDVRRTVARVGLIAALVVVAIGIPLDRMTLVLVGLCCGFVSWRERARLALPFEGNPSPPDILHEDAEIPDRADLRRRQREDDERIEADRILEKISREGMESLTPSEKSLLERVSRRKQQETE